MNYLKYFQNQKYELGKYDCWAFIQEVFESEQGIKLPDLPIFDDPENESKLKANIKHIQLKIPQKGCLVFVRTKTLNHVGYAISDKEYIHKTSNTGVVITRIPKYAEFFEVINE